MGGTGKKRQFSLYLSGCPQTAWLACLCCFRGHRQAIQRLSLTTQSAGAFVEIEFSLNTLNEQSPLDAGSPLSPTDTNGVPFLERLVQQLEFHSPGSWSLLEKAN
jgi:hypothetical protein